MSDPHRIHPGTDRWSDRIHRPASSLSPKCSSAKALVDAPAPEVLDLAREAAGGLDVRLGGGPSTIRQFLDADLVDFMHLAVVPAVLGEGIRLGDDQDGIDGRFATECVSTPGGLVHQLWNRKPR